MRAYPPLTGRSAGRSGWSGAALLAPGGISDGIAELGKALVQVPLQRRQMEQQQADKAWQQARAQRQDDLAETLANARIGDMEDQRGDSAKRTKIAQQNADTEAGRVGLDGLKAFGNGALAVTDRLFHQGQFADKGATSQAASPKPITYAQASRLAIAQAQAEAGPGRKVKPERIAELTALHMKNGKLGGGDDDDSDEAQVNAALPGPPESAPAVSTDTATGAVAVPPGPRLGNLYGLLSSPAVTTYEGPKVQPAGPPDPMHGAFRPPPGALTPQLPPAATSKGTLTRQHLQQAVDAGHFATVEEAAADAQKSGYTVAP